jgi:two-component system LytT family response regulator
MIRCIVVDDEPLAQAVLAQYINQMPGLTLIKTCNNAVEAFEVLHNEKVDLMFLDIRMPGLNGLDFLHALKHPPAVIFATAFSEHAITGFELEAIDYLLKPFTFERFQKGVFKFLKINPEEKAEPKDYHYFKVSGTLVKVQHSDMVFAQSMKDYVLLHTLKGKLIVYMTMKYLDELLPAGLFVRIHRSYLVNKTFITKITKNRVEIHGASLPVGENYRNTIELI